jgi:acetolactate synthase I/II/III large subunit
MAVMNGAENLLRAAVDQGVDTCFANPGTTELPLVGALDDVTEIRPVLGLAEAVCTGAADGFGRMTGRPALTLLHLGPGLADGLACLHNARRAGTPVVNIVGDQATWHLAADAPLTTDIAAVASPFCRWIRKSDTAEDLAADIAEAVAESRNGPACLIVPADLADQKTEPASNESATKGPRDWTKVVEDRVAKAARALRGGRSTVLFLGGAALSRAGLLAADQVARASGCRLIHETFPARIERGGGLPAPVRLPHVYADALAALEDAQTVILAGAREPVSSFGYPGKPSSFVPAESEVVPLAAAPQDAPDDVVDALERLAERAGPSAPRRLGACDALFPPGGDLTPTSLVGTVAAVQPAGAIVVDESLTCGFEYHAAAIPAPEHTCMVAQVGGAIGHGLPLATGAAIACPDRPVIVLEADGSAMYTIQALWTQARENLNVTTIICNNQSYEIVKMELGNSGREIGPASGALLSLDRPELEWAGIAIGLGVPAVKARTSEELSAAMKAALTEPGPHLIEAIVQM